MRRAISSRLSAPLATDSQKFVRSPEADEPDRQPQADCQYSMAANNQIAFNAVKHLQEASI